MVTTAGDAAAVVAARAPWRDRLLVGGWIVGLGAVSAVIVAFVASPHLRAEFFFDEAWRADLIRSTNPLARYRTHNTPIPPLWIAAMKVTSTFLPESFLGLRLQNLVYDVMLPMVAGVIAAVVAGIEHRVRAVAASVGTAVAVAALLTVGGVAIYLNDYAFQALVVALTVLACIAADRLGRGRGWAAAGIIVLPLATLGGLVVLPVLCLWWVASPGPATDRAGWARRLVVPAASIVVTAVVYLWLYRPQIDGELEGFWAAEMLRGGTRSIGAVLVDVPRSLAVNVVPVRYGALRNVGTGLAIMAAAVAGFPTLARAWRWLPWLVASSVPIAAAMSVAGDWPATFVRVNLPFAWLWYLSAIAGVATIAARLGEHWRTIAYVACVGITLLLVPSRTPASDATFARGLYGDLAVVAASPYDHNVVLSYHVMSQFYVHDELVNVAGVGDRFAIVRQESGNDELYADADDVVVDAGWQAGDAVWCVIPYEIGPEAAERACRISLPGLTIGYSERLERALIVGWFPDPDEG